jgi:hypothetical protein
MARDDSHGKPPDADSRIVDHDAILAGARQHDEMIQIPVQHAREPQLRELAELEPQRPRGKADLIGNANEILERRPF